MSMTHQDVERDEMGHGYHACLDPFFKEAGDREDVDCKPWLEANGFEFTFDELDDMDDENPASKLYNDEGSLSLWTPERPEGQGWFLAAVYDNENGAWALFLRVNADPMPRRLDFPFTTTGEIAFNHAQCQWLDRQQEKANVAAPARQEQP